MIFSVVTAIFSQRGRRQAKGAGRLSMLLALLCCALSTDLAAQQTNKSRLQPLPGNALADGTAPAAPARRIVALAPHLVENLYSIGAGNWIVGTTDFADFPAAAKRIPRVGNANGLQIEKIIALQPDLVLAWRSGTSAADIKKLKSLNINVVVTEIPTLADLADHLRVLGSLTGLALPADEQAQRYQARLAELQRYYQHKKKINTFYELWGDPITTVANNAWPAQQLALCGGQNVFANAQGDYPQVGIEQVLAMQPDIIIQPLSRSEKRKVLQWQQWPDIPAVKQKQILQPNADLLHRTTLRMLDGLSRLCQQMDTIRNQQRN